MRVKSATYVRDYKISLLFSDGVTKVVDFKPFLISERKIFIPLQDLEYFKNFHVDEITICWPNGLDFSPDLLYEVGKDVEKKAKKPLGLSKRKNSIRSVPAKPNTRIAANHKH